MVTCISLPSYSPRPSTSLTSPSGFFRRFRYFFTRWAFFSRCSFDIVLLAFWFLAQLTQPTNTTHIIITHNNLSCKGAILFIVWKCFKFECDSSCFVTRYRDLGYYKKNYFLPPVVVFRFVFCVLESTVLWLIIFLGLWRIVPCILYF